MPTMEKKRLLKLARLLEEDAKNKKGVKFDLGVIAAPADITTGWVGRWKPGIDCGTAACAVGLACLSGAFKRAGLGYVMRNPVQIVPSYRGEEGWGTEQVFFGITHVESRFLFNACSYPYAQRTGAVGERSVARRIRKFVADRTIAR
jgi:hypothetical protein